MYSVSDAYSRAILADTREMPFRVTLAGAIVLDQTRIPNMTLTESASGNSSVSVGTANSASLTLTLRDADVVDYDNVLVEPESGLVLPDGSIEWIPLGKFWVTNSSTSNDYKTVTLNCSDGMYHMTGTYTSELTYPTTLRAVVNEIVAKTGVNFVGFNTLPEIVIRVNPGEMTYREAIGYAAGCCGKNARFDREGNLEFFWYNDTGITIERRNQYLNGMTRLNDKPLEVNFEVTGKQETYTITCVSDGNGGITATPGQAVVEDETVVLSINPFSGYELATISAITDSGVSVTLYKSAESGYTFIQPDSNVTVTVSFRASAEGPFNLTVRAYDGGSIIADNDTYNEGDFPTLCVTAYGGYELDRFVTTPAGLGIALLGTTSDGETLYEFEMPKSDVTISAYFKESDVYHTIERIVDYDGLTTTPGYIVIENLTTPGSLYKAGDIISVCFARTQGHVFDYYESDVDMLQLDNDNFQFTMPDNNVSITAHFKWEEDESKTGQYSWLALPANNTPSETKPYWAVFYKHNLSVPTSQRFYLVWFDSWSATGYESDDYGKRLYSIKFNGYFQCGSKDTRYYPHSWDTSTWSGNGSSGSTLKWDSVIGSAWAGNPRYSGDYCLLASNCHLYYNSTLIFQACSDAIQSSAESYLVDGMDIRERGALGYYKCPDTFSTPAPAANWMILNPYDCLLMSVDEDGKYRGYGGGWNEASVVWFDDIAVENVGAVFSDSDEEFYIARVTNGHYTTLCRENGTWGALKDVGENQVIGLRNPTISEKYVYATADTYYFNGLIASSCNISSNGTLLRYKNDCKICDCSGTYSLLRSIRRNVRNVENVTMTYTNPMIYEKSVPAISELVQGVTYTPAKVKHRGNPAFQVGDIVTVPDKNGDYHTVLIMQQTMTFGGGMNSEITCPGQTAQQASFSANGPITAQIKQEVKQASADLEQRLSANNALVFASLHRTIGFAETKITELVEWQTEKAATISKLELKTTEYEASIKSLAKSITENSDSITEVNQRVSDAEAEIDLVAEYSGYAAIPHVDTAEDSDTWDKSQIYYVESLKSYYVYSKPIIKSSGDAIDIQSTSLNVSVEDNKLRIDSPYLKATTNGENIVIVDDGVSWQKTDAPLVNSLAYIRQQADQLGASIGLLVESGEVKGSVVIEAINNDKTSVVRITGDRFVVESSNFTLTKEGTVTAKEAILERATLERAILEECNFSWNDGVVATFGLIPDDAYDYNHHGWEVEYPADGNGNRYTNSLHMNGASVRLQNYNKTGRYSFVDVMPEYVRFYSSDGEILLQSDARFSNNVYFDNGSPFTLSDVNYKNSISDIAERYSMLFDNLRPVIHKYNGGQSGRYHIGFIAQEVDEAIMKAGLVRQDFAGLCIQDEGLEKERWALRYTEFVPLNTYEIQKLKARVAELEAKIGG